MLWRSADFLGIFVKCLVFIPATDTFTPLPKYVHITNFFFICGYITWWRKCTNFALKLKFYSNSVHNLLHNCCQCIASYLGHRSSWYRNFFSCKSMLFHFIYSRDNACMTDIKVWRKSVFMQLVSSKWLNIFKFVTYLEECWNLGTSL